MNKFFYMKRTFFLLTAGLFALLSIPSGATSPAKNQKGERLAALPRIAIAGLAIESSTFSPALTREEAFHAKYGTEVFSSYPFLSAGSPIRQRATWFPTVVGKAIPGGAVNR